MGFTNGTPLINGVAYSWGDITILLGGVSITGVTGIEYGDTQEVVNHYGAGRHPIARSKGKIEPSAKITLTMDEVLNLQRQTVNGRLQDLGTFDVIVSYVPESLQITTDKIRNCQFKGNSRKWATDNTQQTVELELLPSHIEWGR